MKRIGAHLEKLDKNVKLGDLPKGWDANGPKGMISTLDITISEDW